MYCCILHRGVGKRSTNYRPNVPFKHMDKPLNLATSFFEYFIYSYWVILRLESRADLVYGDMQKVDEINYNV